ncbi:probable serine hydrolase isoform X2 [Phymastichus coffea]|uniref:probable serine hydrolase isoform X2 n=1 Tax=Phymastichus coffea TaxID=108790 RepID=UPI00273B02F1|nr:probable serine hydrolase isoform X2 [Phymastichus coffea]
MGKNSWYDETNGKLWGSTNKQPILSIHGWQDNAGTFDMIAPLLKNSSVLAIDLPGHGWSSWLPRGIPYNEDISVECIRIIVNHFGWNEVKLLGHSMGGILCFNYARLYPEETKFVISIDSLAFAPNNMTSHSQRRARAIDRLINFEKKMINGPPSYPEEILIQKWIDATFFSDLDVPTTKVLMIRGANKKADGTYYYTRDFRLTIDGFNSCYTQEEIKEMAQLITCPYLVIKATKSPFYKKQAYWSEVSSILKYSSKDFRSVHLDGSHHLHMMQQDKVADVMNSFLEKYDV